MWVWTCWVSTQHQWPLSLFTSLLVSFISIIQRRKGLEPPLHSSSANFPTVCTLQLHERLIAHASLCVILNGYSAARPVLVSRARPWLRIITKWRRVARGSLLVLCMPISASADNLCLPSQGRSRRAGPLFKSRLRPCVVATGQSAGPGV